MADLAEVQHLAVSLLREHLPPGWSFGFDHARKRAGACHYRDRRITVSRHLAAMHPLEAMHQTLLHEIAHARAGHAAGHGPEWRRAARALGYVGGTTHSLEVPEHLARWVGRCPNGHEIPRFRRPSGGAPRSCARCSRRFDRRFLITWHERPATPEPPAARTPGVPQNGRHV